MKRFFGHLKTVLTHKSYVFVHCVKAGILWRGVMHDMSKFSPVEFFNGVANYTDGKKSPNDKEKEKRGYSLAWLHHKGKNKHHFEYWTELNYKGVYLTAYKMPVKYLKEMICDRVAATKTYRKKAYTDSAALEYFLYKNDQQFMHPDTSAMVLKILTMLKEKGEKETFRFMRNLKKY